MFRFHGCQSRDLKKREKKNHNFYIFSFILISSCIRGRKNFQLQEKNALENNGRFTITHLKEEKKVIYVNIHYCFDFICDSKNKK